MQNRAMTDFGEFNFHALGYTRAPCFYGHRRLSFG